MKKAKETRCYKRLIHEQLLKVSSLCGIPSFSYWPKRLTKLLRALYVVQVNISRSFSFYTFKITTRENAFVFSPVVIGDSKMRKNRAVWVVETARLL